MGPSPLDPREIAARALSRRDLSQSSLASRLRGAGVAPAAARETLDWLVSVGLVDDARLARTRAGRLAERGYGDVAIATKLGREGILREDREAAIAELEPEEERARRDGTDAERRPRDRRFCPQSSRPLRARACPPSTSGWCERTRRP